MKNAPKYKQGQKLFNKLGYPVVVLKVFKRDSFYQNYRVYDEVQKKEYNMREEEFAEF